MVGTTTAPRGAICMAIVPALSGAIGATRGLERDARGGGAERATLSRSPPILDRDIGRILVLHALHVVAGVDVMDFARDAARKLRQEIEA